MAIAVQSSVTQSPAGRTFAQLKRAVVNYLQGPDDPELLDVAGDAINYAIDRLNVRTWNWSLKYQDITLVADDADYSIEDELKKPRKLHLLNSSSKIVGEVCYREPKTFWDFHSQSAVSGTPDAYTVESPRHTGTILLDPAPGSSFVSSYPTARLHYFSRVPHLAQDSDTIDAPPEVGAMVMWHARCDVAATRGERMLAREAERYWRELEARLVTDDGEIQPDWEH